MRSHHAATHGVQNPMLAFFWKPVNGLTLIHFNPFTGFLWIVTAPGFEPGASREDL